LTPGAPGAILKEYNTMNYGKLAEQAKSIQLAAQKLQALATKLDAIDKKFDSTGELTDEEFNLINFTGDQQLRDLAFNLQKSIPNIY
jgi:hypothetical protein